MTATASLDWSALHDLRPGSHVCWIYDDDDTYVSFAQEILRGATRTGEKPVVFGPEGSAARAALAPLAAMVADPRLAVLDGGPLEPAAMFAMFHDQTARARDEGYTGIRLVADMDWLLPAGPSAAAVVGFEVLLDQHARRLGATIVCAYRRTSFTTDLLSGACAVHPLDVDADEPPQFRLHAADGAAWALRGELDIAADEHFAAAIGAVTAAAPSCTIDVSDLRFIDVKTMTTLAHAATGPVRLVGAGPLLRRGWNLLGFGADAPLVTLD